MTPGLTAHAAELQQLRDRMAVKALMSYPYREENEYGRKEIVPVPAWAIEQQIAHAIESNDELWHMWHAEATARSDRRASKSGFDFSGPISDLELVQMQFNAEATPEQHRAACLELRERFKNDKLDVLEHMARKAAR
jgi:hypothetical protein